MSGAGQLGTRFWVCWELVLVALSAGAVPGIGYVGVVLPGAWVQDGVEIGALVYSEGL